MKPQPGGGQVKPQPPHGRPGDTLDRTPDKQGFTCPPAPAAGFHLSSAPASGFHLPSCAPCRVSPALLRPLPGFTCPPAPASGFDLPSCAPFLGFTCSPAPPPPGFTCPPAPPLPGFTCPPAPPFLRFTCPPVPALLCPLCGLHLPSRGLPRPDFGFHLLSRGRAPFLGFTCPPEQLTKPETLPLLEDAERKDEHDANLTTRRGPGVPGGGVGAGHSRVTGRGQRKALLTPTDYTWLPLQDLAASEPLACQPSTPNPEASVAPASLPPCAGLCVLSGLS